MIMIGGGDDQINPRRNIQKLPPCIFHLSPLHSSTAGLRNHCTDPSDPARLNKNENDENHVYQIQSFLRSVAWSHGRPTNLSGRWTLPEGHVARTVPTVWLVPLNNGAQDAIIPDVPAYCRAFFRDLEVAVLPRLSLCVKSSWYAYDVSHHNRFENEEAAV